MNIKHCLPLVTALGLLVLNGCMQPPLPDNREADTKALREGEVASFVADWGGKDADRIAAHYTDNGNLIIPSVPVMTGKDAISKGMKATLTDPNWSLAMQPVQVEVSRGDDLAYLHGT